MDYDVIQVLAALVFLIIILGVYNLRQDSIKVNYKILNVTIVALFALGVFLLIMAVLPYGNFYGTVQNNLHTNKKVVALTFDDGPYPPYTQELLQVLDAEDVKATFFMVGANAAKYPELVRQVVQKGHVIGVHTMHHIDLLKLDRLQKEQQIAAGKMVLQEITGVSPEFFRPPHGFRDWQVLSIAGQQGLKTINWSILSKDWLNPPPEEIAARTLKQVKPGSIILLHDGDSPYNQLPRANTVQAVRIIIKELKKQGYEFVTIDW